MEHIAPKYVEPVNKEQLSSLCRRFINGLETKHGFTLEDLVKQKFRYIGGYNTGGDYQGEWACLNYENHKKFRYLCMNKGGVKNAYEFLHEYKYIHRCICDTPITVQCFVESVNGYVLVIGSCCIKRFDGSFEGGMKLRCFECKEIYRYALKDVCGDCRKRRDEKSAKELKERMEKERQEQQEKWDKERQEQQEREWEHRRKINEIRAQEKEQRWKKYAERKKMREEDAKKQFTMINIHIPFAKKDYYKSIYHLKWNADEKTWQCYAKDYDALKQSLEDNRYKKLTV
jgi:hypothetical protein